MIERRIFLRDSALAMAGIGLAPAWLARAADGTGSRKVLVALFQRGAMDGLNVVIPFRDKRYVELRPSIAIASPVDLNGTFGLHPSLDALKPLWDRKQLAIVHAVGSPDPTRSHFDAQDYMESGTPGRKATRDGWLNRAMPPAAAATPLRAVSMGPQLPRSMRGANSAVAIANIREFKLRDKGSMDELESMYSGTAPGRDTFAAMKLIESIDRSPYSPAGGAIYPESKFGQSLQQIARLIKANVGLEVAFADIGGWDTHTNQSPRLANLLSDFGRSIAAFCADLGDRFEDVMLVTMSEFGRTARENGSGGTDHGHANVMFVAGGSAALQGGRVHGVWPGLDREQLDQARDLAVTTDFRSVWASSSRRTWEFATLPAFSLERWALRLSPCSCSLTGMHRRAKLAVTAGLVVVSAAFAQRGFRSYGDEEDNPAPMPADAAEKTEWAFGRLRYGSGGGGRRWGGGSWATDYPKADRQFVQGVRRLTRIHTKSVEQVVDINSDEIFTVPWIYAVEVGWWSLDDRQAARLREYLRRGGFLMVDDFHGTDQWASFMQSMQLVFPDRTVVDLDDKDQIFHVLYDLKERFQVPGIQMFRSGHTYERDGYDPKWRGILDDKGRIMVAICHNMDLGDAWEWADHPRYPENYASLAYRVGVNYIIYAMTH